MRLSRDDEKYGDSVSIETQRTILRQFASDNNLHVVDEYVDDGWSGTNFERPDFKRMMDDVEAGKINCIVTKDLSRFGREHVMMDYYLEFMFPEKHIRYIAVTENEDTEKGLSDFVPFKNLFNEWFAKDTSRKVKAAFRAKHVNGERTCAYAPLGYKKSPDAKNRIVPDEETRWIIEKIFDLAVHGAGAAKITRVVRKPKEDWFKVENTHEPLISKSDFEQVQEQTKSRRRQKADSTTQIFAGLVRCADCGWSMSYGTNKTSSNPFSYFNCTNYRQFGKKAGTCTAHYIRYDVLYQYVLTRIRHWAKEAHTDEEKLLENILKAGDRERAASKKKQAAELKKAEKRKTELDNMFARMYEDWAAGRITESNFSMLTQRYQTEQEELELKIQEFKEELEAEQQSIENAENWIRIIKEIGSPEELTAEILNALIEKIIIHEATEDDFGFRQQEIEIIFRFVGKID